MSAGHDVMRIDIAGTGMTCLLEVAGQRDAMPAVPVAVLFKLGGGVGLVRPGDASLVVAYKKWPRPAGGCRLAVLFADPVLLFLDQTWLRTP